DDRLRAWPRARRPPRHGCPVGDGPGRRRGARRRAGAADRVARRRAARRRPVPEARPGRLAVDDGPDPRPLPCAPHRRHRTAVGPPAVVAGLEPIPQAPVDTPTDPQAERIAQAATAATFRVTTRACDSEVNGTAFIVAPGYLVTNAHVVAGASTIRVAQSGT